MSCLFQSSCHTVPSLRLSSQFLLPVCRDRTSPSGRYSYSASTYAVGSLFFCLGGGRLIHNILLPVLKSLTENPTVSFTNSSPRVYLRTSLSVLLHPKRRCCVTPLSLMPLQNTLPVPVRTWSLCNAGKARWVSCSTAVENSCTDSPSSSWFRVFTWLRDSTARCWSPNPSSVSPIVSSYVASLGTPYFSADLRVLLIGFYLFMASFHQLSKFSRFDHQAFWHLFHFCSMLIQLSDVVFNPIIKLIKSVPPRPINPTSDTTVTCQ